MCDRFKSAVTNTGGHEATRSLDWMVWLEPALVIILAPVFLFPTPRRSILFVFLPLIFIIHFIARRRIVERSAANAPLALILLMVLVSLYATYDINFSLPKIAGTLLGAAVFFAIINSVSSSRSIAILLGLFILGSIGLSIMGLLGTQWIYKVPVLGGITAHLPIRLKGLPGAEEGFHPNAVAGGLILFLPLQIALLLSVRRNRLNRRLVILLAASLLFNAGVLALTQSRGGWFGMAIGGLLLVAWMHRRGRWVVLAAFVLASAAVLWLGPAKVGDKIMASVGNSSGVSPSIEGRLEVWNRAVYGISDFPFTGMGMNTFRKVVHVLYPLFLTPPDTDIASCHNQLLQTALDLGIPGLVAYVALLAAAITMGIRIRRHGQQQWMRASAQGLVCGIVAQQVFGITDAIPLGAKVGIFFWVALGLLAAMHVRDQRSEVGGRISDLTSDL
jgi:putative inorganic carbon (HCO3(-)) transporter